MLNEAEKQFHHAITDEVIAAYKEGYHDVMTSFPIYRDPAKEATRQGLAKAFAAFTRIYRPTFDPDKMVLSTEISEETKRHLDDIDANIRNAAIRARDIFLD